MGMVDEPSSRVHRRRFLCAVRDPSCGDARLVRPPERVLKYARRPIGIAVSFAHLSTLWYEGGWMAFGKRALRRRLQTRTMNLVERFDRVVVIDLPSRPDK